MIKTKVLNSGTRLAVCNMPSFEGVSFKMFVFCGSGNESDPKDYGISHLIEHMFFKGTKKRNAYQIVQEFDKLGIQSNAYTSNNTTCYYTYGTGETLEKSVEIMSDMLFNSLFDEEELAREKLVVCEEIDMYQDRPDAVCEMALLNNFFKGTNFAHDIAGSKESVLNISREQILKYFKKHYSPKNIILSFAGNVTFEKAEELVNKYFEPYFKKQEKFEFKPIKYNFNIEEKQVTTKKAIKQAQLMIAYKAENRFEEKETLINGLISNMLGGGMSSRLFQEVREKLGLVYSISSYNDVGDLASVFSISLGTSPKKVPLALKTINCVIQDVIKNGFTKEELIQAKNMTISAIKLQSDSPSNMASRIASSLQYKNKIVTKEESIEKCKKITLEEVNQQAKKLFNNQNCIISMVGKNTEIDLFKYYSNKKNKDCEK